MRRRISFVLACIGCALCAALLLNSCASVPSGYDADTTPDRDGEEWVGGQ